MPEAREVDRRRPGRQHDSRRVDPISALVCTRNRGGSVVGTVESILVDDEYCDEVLVIDQSDDDETELAVRPLLKDSRVRYVRSNTQGKGVALNLGLEVAQNEIVAITDDDCEVDAAWGGTHARAFARYPKVAVTFGSVLAVDHDRQRGFIPTYVLKRSKLCKNIWDKLTARGIGANMAVRRKAIVDLGGFDPSLGPGGRFQACVDGDVAVRSLLAGHHVFETRDTRVYHSGFRDWSEGRTLTRNAWIGIGAAYLKLLKCGRLDALPLYVFEFVVGALLPAARATLTFQRRKGWLRVTSFLRGSVYGLRTPVDRHRLLYRIEKSVSGPERSERTQKGPLGR